MKAATVKQIQSLDHTAIKEYGIPSLCLMENAGRAVADELARILANKKNPKVSLFCGLGNNAGDGFVAARHLLNTPIKTETFLIGKGTSLKKDAAVNYQILKNIHYPIRELDRMSPFIKKSIREADCVVDAIFGVGLNREILDPFKSIIQAINEYARRIISIDIPSGLNGTTGDIFGVCIKADTTITFSLPKRGFYKNKGPALTGKVVVADIGIPFRRE